MKSKLEYKQIQVEYESGRKQRRSSNTAHSPTSGERDLPFDQPIQETRAIYLKRLCVFFSFVAANLAFIFAHFLPFPLKVIVVITVATFWGFYTSKTLYSIPSRIRKVRNKFFSNPSLEQKKGTRKTKKIRKNRKFFLISFEMLISALTATIAVLLTLLLDFGMQNESRAESDASFNQGNILPILEKK